MIMLYGGIHHFNLQDKVKSKIAGNSIFFGSTGLYSDLMGKEVQINPRTSISSPDLQEINRAQIPFIETADTLKFKRDMQPCVLSMTVYLF
jgi:hypothetical protein